jgi:transposase-like protein
MCGVSGRLNWTQDVVVTAERKPVSGRDYPATLQQLQRWFADDEACRAYLEGLRWPDGWVCPRCEATEAWRTGGGLWLCRSCKHKTSVTAGTVFHGSRLPLTTWFAAIWLVCSQKNGVSALGLSRVLGVSPETAWVWLHKLRRAMVRPDRDRLAGLVEVDETYVGAREAGTAGRRTTDKAIVVIAAELQEDAKGLGRVRMAVVPRATREHLIGFVRASVAPGTVVRTDGWNVYDVLPEEGYRHDPVSIRATGDLAHVAMPGVHRVASLLKRWLTGTLHYGVSREHLEYYLDEFTFRFNRRNSRARGLLFYRLLQQALASEPHPEAELVGGGLDHYIWG